MRSFIPVLYVLVILILILILIVCIVDHLVGDLFFGPSPFLSCNKIRSHNLGSHQQSVALIYPKVQSFDSILWCMITTVRVIFPRKCRSGLEHLEYPLQRLSNIPIDVL
jgi:hypothetical protein